MSQDQSHSLLSNSLNEIIKREFGQGKEHDARVTVRGAIERAMFLDGEIRRTINRVTKRAKAADMFGAVDPDDIQEGLDHLATALNAINAAFDSFESAADVWGVTPAEVAEIVDAAGGRIAEPLPQPGTFIKGDGEAEVELRQLASNKFLIISPDARTEYIGSIDSAMSIYDSARFRALKAQHTLTRDQLLADDPKQIAPEDVPGYPHK